MKSYILLVSAMLAFYVVLTHRSGKVWAALVGTAYTPAPNNPGNGTPGGGNGNPGGGNPGNYPGPVQ